jgi:hypothetical protein
MTLHDTFIVDLPFVQRVRELVLPMKTCHRFPGGDRVWNKLWVRHFDQGVGKLRNQ